MIKIFRFPKLGFGFGFGWRSKSKVKPANVIPFKEDYTCVKCGSGLVVRELQKAKDGEWLHLQCVGCNHESDMETKETVKPPVEGAAG